jgi:hypothetical protein
MIGGLNSTFISLVPKKYDPLYFDDFKSISVTSFTSFCQRYYIEAQTNLKSHYFGGTIQVLATSSYSRCSGLGPRGASFN